MLASPVGESEGRRPLVAKDARLLFVLLLAILIIRQGTDVVATTCAPSTAAQSAENADAIFYGSVSAQKERPDLAPTPLGTPWEVGFLIDRAFKGSVTRELQVISDTSFRIGAKYTVFTFLREGSFATSACSGTVEGEIDPKAYGLAGEIPMLDKTPEPSLPSPGEPSPVELRATPLRGSASAVPGLVAGLAVAGVAGAALFYALRRRARG